MDHDLTMRRLVETLARQAIRSGFRVRQTEKGQYLFSKDGLTIVSGIPDTTQQWWNLLQTLRQAGMDWPPPTRWEAGDRR